VLRPYRDYDEPKVYPFDGSHGSHHLVLSDGALVEILLLPDGGLVECTLPSPLPSWPPAGPPGLLWRFDHNGNELWRRPVLVSHPLPEAREAPPPVAVADADHPLAGAFLFDPNKQCTWGDRVAMAAWGHRLYVVEYCRNLCGAYVFGLDLDNGEVVWEHPVHGVEPVPHGRYRNEVRAQIVDGNLHVLGDDGWRLYREIIAPYGARLATQQDW
jgi:hypothetical protein